jgi:S-adenosylmethionine:tRNA ribosyltransferase-isomerase
MHPSEQSISNFTYVLPDDRIARYPLEQRDASKLLLYKKGEISQDSFSNIDAHIPQGSLLVFNNSRVMEARLLFQKETGGIIEIFALEPHEQYPDITSAMNTCSPIRYKCLVGGAGKWKRGMVLHKTVQKGDAAVTIAARISDRRPDCFVIDFDWQPADLPFAEVLHALGQMPIPPYLHREAEPADNERYQTIYAKEEGSVAAPTAGLHFTPAVFEKLQARQIGLAYLTLHVGAGTFMPVKSTTMAGHQMHAEFMDVDAGLLRRLGEEKGIVIPVGTTSMRTLESLYWMGLKTFLNPAIPLSELEISQWEAYENTSVSGVSAGEALGALVQWMEARQMQRLIVKTQILIAPGYRFRICKGLITNFHQPQSTLLLLVAAMLGNDWKKVYDYALQHEFRFLSYGDSSLLIP